MARIAIGSYLVRFPLGGYLSWVLQWLLGLHRLGHDVWLLEKAGWRNACYDPRSDSMSDDCSYGVSTLNEFLSGLGLGEAWCFVDADERYYGLSKERTASVIAAADLFLDMGAHGSWEEETSGCLRVLLDGEPAYTQMKMEQAIAAGEDLAPYDRYYTVGLNVGRERSFAPTVGKEWRWFFDPVVVDLFGVRPLKGDSAFTTVMSWQAHEPIEFDGEVYGQKDVEFVKFIELPRLVGAPMEIAVAGKDVPRDELEEAGWRVRSAHGATITYDAWADYIAGSRGEFTVCKNVFVETWSGWFSDRSAIYLASGRPVVMQDTGFSEHLPCGEGLFAVCTVDEAAAAIEEISADYERHSRAARAIAEEYLATDKVLPKLLAELGL